MIKEVVDLLKHNIELFENERKDKTEVNALKKDLEDVRAKLLELNAFCCKMDNIKGKVEELEA